jgi:hypothetical protein
MTLNLLIEIILLISTVLAFNGFIYSLTLFKLNGKNSSENIPLITNSSKKDVLTPTLLLASTHLRLTSSESSASETSSVTSSESSASETLYETSSETLSETSNETNLSEFSYEILPEDRFGNFDLTEEDMRWLYEPYVITPNNLEIGGGPLPSETDVYAISLDSITQLSRENYEQWRAISGDLHDLPLNTPYNILRQVKFEELNILYRDDLINFSITQTELRVIIEQINPLYLWSPDINHLILTILSYYHT